MLDTSNEEDKENNLARIVMIWRGISNSSYGKLKERTLNKKLYFPWALPPPSLQSSTNILETLPSNPNLDSVICEHFLHKNAKQTLFDLIPGSFNNEE